LNLIERLWKNVKCKLRTKYYDNFSEFSAKIDSILRFENIKDKKDVDKLISEKVQLFDNLVPIGGSTFTTEEVKK
jgi:hypothetical protein